MQQKTFDLNTLNGINGFTVSGLPNYHLGDSVGTAGDINGDGLSDLVFGSTEANSYAGASYVIFGNRGGFASSFDLTNLNGVNGFTVLGVVAGGGLGISGSTAGDLNGDGISDLVLGAIGANSNAGASYVIFGNRGGFGSIFNLTNLNGTNGFTISGLAGVGYLGYSVSTAGDINGDGLSDLVLGAIGIGVNSTAGASYVIFGSRGGFSRSFNLTNLNGTNGFMVPGIASGDRLGRSVSTAGDINGDGISDLILGAYTASSNAGASYVIFGSRSRFTPSFNLTNLNGNNGFTVPGVVAGGFLGQSVSTAGDINGDGIGDLVLGSSAGNSGASYVIFGNRGGFGSIFNLTNLNGSNGFTVPGLTAGDYLGKSVSTAGDMNGDGISDLVLGAYQANFTVGASYVIFGTRAGFGSIFNLANLNGSNGFKVPGIASPGGLGSSVSTASDLNGDGMSDIVLGAPYVNSYAGASYVIFGKFPLVLLNNQMIITEGQTVVLTNTQLNAMDIYNPGAALVFTVSNLQGGRFELVSNPGTAVTTFTQQQIANNQIRFLSDRTAVVSYAVSVTNGQSTLQPIPANVTFTNHAPDVISIPATQLVEPNKPFQFSLQADQIFNDTDGDPLRYSATLSGGAALPSWMRFDSQSNQLAFSGTAPAPGGTVVSLSAQDPLNATAKTQFEVLAASSGNQTSITNGSAVNQIAVPVAVAVGISSLAAAAFGFWRYFSNKKGREGHQLANYLRDSLKLKGVDNFYETENGRKYVTTVQGFSDALKLQGIDVGSMENDEIKSLADDIAYAARNKITNATDCLGYSVITVSDLKSRMQDIVVEAQQLRSDYSSRPTVT